MTTQSITSGQKKQYSRLIEDAAEWVFKRINVPKDDFQKVIERGDEFQSDIETAIMSSIKKLAISDQFIDEEVESSYGYLSVYKPKGITEQTDILRQIFPSLGFADEKIGRQPLPPHAEGWFAIPSWYKIAPTYGHAVQKVLDLIRENRNGKLYNWFENQPQYLRQSIKTAKAFQMFGDEQKDPDILVVPAQFGLRHRGRSVRRAREVMNAGEFGLGAFAIGVMILTHSERLQTYEDLWIDCAGDEFSPDADGRFGDAPCFYFLEDDRVGYGPAWFDEAGGHCGSASGFLPQQYLENLNS
jgi:hypothetical protein